MKRIALGAAAVAVLAALFVLAVHMPPVRRLVLRYAVAEVQRRYGIRIEADRLDYNLAALTMGLSGTRVAADATPQAPFFTADYVQVALSRRALTGVVAFDDITITNGHVRIARDRDGRTNLPSSSATASGEPAALDVTHVGALGLAVDLQDAQGNLAVAIPALNIDMSKSTGRVSLAAPATIAVGNTRTRVTLLDGGAAFDGRSLTLAALRVRSDEVSGQIDGTVGLLVREPSLDVHAAGGVDLEQLARWAVAPDGSFPRGNAMFDAHAFGALAMPAADVSVSAAQVAWQQADTIGSTVTVSDVTAMAHVNADALNLHDARVSIAGGMVRATGVIPFSNAAAHLAASWTGIDAAALTTTLAGKVSVAPSGSLSGTAELSGPLADASQWAAGVRLRADGGVTSRGRVAIPGDTHLQLADGRWQIDARHRAAGTIPIAVAAGGQLDASSLANSTLAGHADVAEANVGALVRLLRTTGIADVADDSVSGGTASATVMLSGRFASPRIEATVDGRNLEGAQFRIPDVHATASGDPARPMLSFTARAAAATIADQQVQDVAVAGRIDGTVLTVERVSAAQGQDRGVLSLAGTYDLKAEKYDASLDVRSWAIAPTADRPLDATVDATFRGAGTTTAPVGSGTLRVARASWDGNVLGDLAADVTLDGQAASVNGRAPGLNATFEARANVRAPYAAVGDLRVDRIDLARVIPHGVTPVTVTGTLTASAHLEGLLDNLRDGAAHLDVTEVDARLGDLPITLTAPARVDYAGRQVRVERLDARAGATRMSASGELPGRGLQFLVNGDIGEAARAVEATGLAMLPITGGSGPIAIVADVRGTLEMPVISGDLNVGPGSIAIKDLSEATDVTLAMRLENDTVTVRQAHATYEGATLDATGSMPLALLAASPAPGGVVRPGSLHATATGITPAVLRGILDPATLEDVAGTVDVAVNVESLSIDPSRIDGDITLTRLDLQLAGLPVVQRTPTRIVAKDGFARVESWNWAGQGATLGVFGQVRLSDRQAAIIANGDIDLRVLTPFVRSAGLATAGRLVPKFSVTGPIDAPRIDGDVALENGEVRLLDPRVVISGLAGRASLTRTTATVRTLTGSINGGSLDGVGAINYDAGAGLTARLSAGISDMALEFPAGLRSEIDAMLQLDASAAPGAAVPSGSLTGSVTVLRGAYREPLAVVGGLLAASRAKQASAAVGIGEAAGFLDQLALDIKLQTDDDLVVDNNYARVQIGADLDVIGTATAPALSGRATLRDGGRLFIGRNIYTIKPDVPSTIDFASAVAIQPELNVHVTTRVAREDIDVDLTGPAESPQVAMSSTNGDTQADITALLLTGRKLDELGATDAAFIGTQVIGNLSGEVLGFAGRAIGLDTLRLGGVEDSGTQQDPNAIATEVDPTSRLTFGKALGPDVDVTFSQSLRDSTAQTWIVDYLPAHQLGVRVVSGDTDLRTYGFRHDVSFGGTTPAAAARATAAPRRRESRVTDVTVDGELGFPERRVRALLKLRAGRTFDFAEWEADRDRIEAFYHQNGKLAARVTAGRAANGDEVKLAYTIDAGPQTSIAVTGVDLSRDETDRLAAAWAASITDEFLVDEATQIVRGALAARGYLQPMVDANVTGDAEAKTLRVAVQPGSRTTETRVAVQSPDGSLTSDLEARIADRHLAAQVIGDPGAVARDLTAYLRARGYARATVKVATPHFTGGVADVPIVVTPGPLLTIAAVAFDGRRGIGEPDLTAAAALTTGAPYDPAAIDAARERLLTLYRGRGYSAAAVESRADIAADGASVTVTFGVRENPRQIIGDVIVSGSGGVDADVVTRALNLTVGGSLEPAELLRARTRVFNTGLFRRVDVTTEAMPRVGGADAAQPMRVRADVEAWPALRLRYGVQVAEERPETDPTGRRLEPGLTADVTRRTLFGRAVSLGGVLQYERRQRTARALLNAPTLLALPIQSSLVLERVHEESQASSFATDRNSVSWEQRLKRASHLAFSYSYRFDRDHTFDTAADTSSGLNFDIRIRVARLIGTAAWDTRNDPLDAVRGSLVSSSLQWAPDRLGSQFRFLKYVGQAYRFESVHGVVLASAARVGLVRPLGGQELIISERFFAGGARTVRGVDEGALGTRDIFGDPSGGQGMLVLNQEARVPLYKWLGGVAFIDAGNVFPEARNIRLNQLTGSIGVGLRVSTPFALIRVDYGRITWTGATAPAAGSTLPHGAWVIGIGQAF